VPLQDEIEPDLEDLLLRRAGMGVREGVACGGELGEEAARHREMDAAELGGPGLDDEDRSDRSRRRWSRGGRP
jgi:hypothetical protein